MNRNKQHLLQQGLIFLSVILLVLFSWNIIQSRMKEPLAMEPIKEIKLLPTPPIIIHQSNFKNGSITIPPIVQ